MVGIIIFNALICFLVYFYGKHLSSSSKRFIILDLFAVFVISFFMSLKAYFDIEKFKEDCVQQIIEDYENGEIDCETTIKINDQVTKIEKRYFYKK